ncbi:hypothetical protein BJ875DRAFT_268844 [Amylocarpus encephaloides]|uniref:DUF1640 domain-containing protein n=1 Tax=Amylocarpus encephaloides TaxID=45428 RepID=A0A9P7YLP2_9HELO|nr:hypothetical protein BJ875DRAFT_268844 [Amylocarpus encephaloides]
MSTTRLTFLYPHLFRSIRSNEPITQNIRRHNPTPQIQCMNSRGFVGGSRREQRFVQRHGKAVEPIPTASKNAIVPLEAEPAKENKDQSSRKDGEKDVANEEESSKATKPPSEPLSDETQTADKLPRDDVKSAGKAAARKKDKGGATNASEATASEKKSPTETILEMPPPPTPEEENAKKPPHLQTPPYIHHFDTYSLVQRVEEGGFTNQQSITAMKAVRGLLALNLDVAKAGLVSKSDVENEAYLFRAACSELKTEVENSRKANEETMRRERTLLQHEVDILNQKVTQEVASLKDDLKGMFDDRKMAVREEQRTMNSSIQELNYKITVALNSDSKSEVEGLRWVLTRRSVMGILVMAFMVLTSLRYASYKSHEDEEQKKKAARTKADEPLPHFSDLPAAGVAEILTAN